MTFPIPVVSNQHPSDHEFDLLIMHRVGPEERLRLEMHLLTCPVCSRQAKDTAEFVTALRSVCCMGPTIH